MKNSSPKKHSATPEQPHLSTAKPRLPKASVAIALKQFDFSLFPPKPKSTQADLGDELVNFIGSALLDGIAAALIQHDTQTFIQCYQALHFCLGQDMESRRLNFGPPGKVAFLMTAYQAAVLFQRHEMVIALFQTCLASPEHPIRAGISSPVSMLTHAYSAAVSGDFPPKQDVWPTHVSHMIASLVHRLAVVDPEELCPATGRLFDLCNALEPGDNRDVLTVLCNGLSDRYSESLAQSSGDASKGSGPSNRRL